MRSKNLSGAILAIVAGCLLAGALMSAGPASAASRKWTVLNHDTRHLSFLELVSVTPWEDNPFGFEGRPENGSKIDRDGGRQHFELKYGANYQALLKYRIHFDLARDRTNDYVEYWINNRLGFIFASCRFIDGDKTTDWSGDGRDIDHHFAPNSSNGFVAHCGATSALGIGSRVVWFSDHPPAVRPPE